MTYTLKINSVTASKPNSLSLKSSLTTWAGSFEGEIRDAAGTFDIKNGYELEVFEDATKVFGGVIRNCSRGLGKISFSGLDYTVYLSRVFVNEVYHNETVDFMVKDLVEKYAPGLTVTGVYSTTTVLSEMRFRNVQFFKALQQLAKYDSCNFYVTKAKDLVFDKLGTTDSGISLAFASNILTDDWEEIDDNLVNKVKITGGREDYTKTESFTGNGSNKIFTLQYKPISVKITVNGTEVTGFKEGMKTLSEYDYTTDKENKQIVFNNAPAELATVSIQYNYSTPVLVQSQSDSSIDSHTVYEKVIYDETINKKSEALALAAQLLAKQSEPVKSGSSTTRINFTATVGESLAYSNPKKGVEGNFIIVEMQHQLFGKGFRTTYKLASLTQGVMEVMAELFQRVEALEETQRGDVALSSYLRSFDDAGTMSDDPANDLSIRTRTVNKTNTGYFATPHQFSEPIKFGGGSGPYSTNRVSGASN